MTSKALASEELTSEALALKEQISEALNDFKGTAFRGAQFKGSGTLQNHNTAGSYS